MTTTNASFTLGSGFSSHNGRNNWLGSDESASITITPNEGYFIESIETPEGISATKNGDRTWTLALTNPSSPIYSSPYTMSADTTIKAIAVKDGMNPVAVVKNSNNMLPENGFTAPANMSFSRMELMRIRRSQERSSRRFSPRRCRMRH